VNKHKAEQFARERANELRSLARVLLDRDLVRDVGPLEHAASLCAVWRSNSDYRWSYDFQGLSFRGLKSADGGLRHSRPRCLQQVELELHLELAGTCLDEDEPADPLVRLAIDLEVTGETDHGDILTGAWHLDRHISTPRGDDPEGGDYDSDFAHPHYHLQYGGRRVWDKSDPEFGTHLLLEPPRIAHPPLDGVLAVDFVLSNYFGPQWRLLRSESPVYNELVAGAQRRLWRPYALATAAHWAPYGEREWYAEAIWPQLFLS
jgi:hypothetical protein